jgi:hypothetical protein
LLRQLRSGYCSGHLNHRRATERMERGSVLEQEVGDPYLLEDGLDLGPGVIVLSVRLAVDD